MRNMQCIPLEHRADDIITLPYYGGAKGQVLQIRQKPDGSVVSEIVQHPLNDQIQDSASKAEKVDKPEETFEYNLKTIQKAAAVLVNLQHNIKAAGKLTDDDQKLYSENLEKLGVSAQKLAHLQSDTGTDDFRLLFQNPLVSRIPDTIKGTIDKIENNKKPGKKEEEEENVGEESDKEENEDKDSVQVNTPDKDASVAEAKPVGLAIAGEGGVASSKPVATAVVGPGGLAVARPVATAIAGIEPSQVSQLGIPIPTKVRPNLLSRVSFPLRKKYGFDDEGLEDGIGLLVGPGYRPQTRSVSQKEIEAFMDEQNLNKEILPEEIIQPKSENTPSDDMYELAVAPETMLPNRYPLMPPNFGGYVSQMARWESDGVLPSTGFNPISFQQNRAIHHEPQILPLNPQNAFRIFVY